TLAWEDGATVLSDSGNYTATFTPDAAFEGLYTPATVDVPVTVVPDVPGAPTIVSLTPGAERATLIWSAPSVTGGAPITNYEVTFGDGSGGTSIWLPLPASANSQTFSNLTNGTNYTFSVRAVNVAGAGREANASVAPAADKTALTGEVNTANGAVPGLTRLISPPYYKENYRVTVWENLLAAYNQATAVLNSPTSTQAEVDAAFAWLAAALGALGSHDHPVVGGNGSPLSSPDYNHALTVTTFGQGINIEFKGHVGTVESVSLNGALYTLEATDAGTAEGHGAYRLKDASGAEIGKVTSGSAIVELYAAHVDAFANGGHVLSVSFRDPAGAGSGAATIQVNRVGESADEDEDNNVDDDNNEDDDDNVSGDDDNDEDGGGTPDTGDDMNLLLWLSVCGASLTGLLVCLLLIRRRKKEATGKKS
ncbi:MAG: fibronectin type III domain-containing protein, partial [Clostridiales Family XIII bacterium]|nr:fibronectin type III domain-containing protein [Clostridiales Family XIII bacterium]